MKSKQAYFFILFFLLMCFGVSPARAACRGIVSGTTPDGAYDFSTALFQGGLEDTAGDWPRIWAYGIPVRKLKGGKEEVMAATERIGRVIVVPPRYIITPYHIADLETYTVRRQTPFGITEIEEKADFVRNEMYALQLSASTPSVPLKKILTDPEIDTALFEFANTDSAITSNLPLGTSDELCLGHVIYILGSPGIFGTGIHVREGIVSAFHFITPELISDPNGKKATDIDISKLISISANLDRGDSGSPIVALRDGKPEIIGFSSNVFSMSSLMHGINMVVPIDEVVRKAEAALHIDLKKLSDDYFHK